MSSSSHYRPTDLLAWFAYNPVAANLLMILIIIGGIAGFKVMDKEVFPRFNPQQIEIMAEYPGAGPLEIEESVCVRIEEAISDMPGIKRQTSAIQEGRCTVKVSILPDYDQDQAINSLRGRIQNIPRLPKNLEKIDIQPAIRNDDDGVIWVALHGPTNSLTLQRFGEHIRADLEQIPGVLRVRNYGEIPYEIVPGSRYFCESFYGHPCPTSGKNYATAHACGGPSRPASFVGYPTRGIQHHSRNDSTRCRKACIFTTQKDAS